jgi:hypothetical protein
MSFYVNNGMVGGNKMVENYMLWHSRRDNIAVFRLNLNKINSLEALCIIDLLYFSQGCFLKVIYF